MITVDQWNLIEKAEKPLYHGNAGAHAFTSVWEYGDTIGMNIVNALWEIASSQAESYIDDGPFHDNNVDRETAERVAVALAVMAFGKDFITPAGTTATITRMQQIANDADAKKAEFANHPSRGTDAHYYAGMRDGLRRAISIVAGRG